MKPITAHQSALFAARPERVCPQRAVTTLAFVAFMFGFLALAQPLSAVAAPQDEGIVNALLQKPADGLKSVKVEALDDSDDNLLLVKDIERELRALGYKVEADADAILTLEVSDEIGAFSETDKRYFFELRAEGSGGGEYRSARVNLLNSRTGGVINEGNPGTTIVTPSVARITLTLDGSASGERIWSGWAAGELGQRKPLQLKRALVRPLMQELGKTVDRKAVPLP